MPVEIRELVVQAQLDENEVSDPNDMDYNKGAISSEEVEGLVEEQFNIAFSEMKNVVIREMKIWIKEYLENQQRRF